MTGTASFEEQMIVNDDDYIYHERVLWFKGPQIQQGQRRSFPLPPCSAFRFWQVPEKLKVAQILYYV